MNIGHFGSLRTKSSKNVYDVLKLVQRGNSVPYPIWLAFRSRNCTKIGGKVAHTCLSFFMVETSGYDSPRTNQGPLRRTPAVWGNIAWQCASTGQRTNRVWIEGASMPPYSETCTIFGSPSPAQSLNLPTECRTEGRPARRLIDGPSMEFHLWGYWLWCTFNFK